MGHNPTSPGASEPVEARSLSELLTLASDPPAYPRNPTHKKLEPLSLYIVRVPGSKDVFLSPLKPGQKDSISPESLGASLYFLHVSSPDDEVLLQQVKEELGEAKPKSEEEPPSPTEDPQEQDQYTSGDEGYYENGTQVSQVSQVYYHELQEQPSNSSWKSKEPPGPGHLSYTCSNGQKFEIVTRPGRRRPEPVVDESDTDDATPTNGSQQNPPPVPVHAQPVVNEPVGNETNDGNDAIGVRPPPTPVRGDVAEEARHILPYVGGSQPELPLELERGSMDTVRQSNVDQQRQHEREAATAALQGLVRSQPPTPGQDDMPTPPPTYEASVPPPPLPPRGRGVPPPLPPRNPFDLAPPARRPDGLEQEDYDEQLRSQHKWGFRRISHGLARRATTGRRNRRGSVGGASVKGKEESDPVVVVNASGAPTTRARNVSNASQGTAQSVIPGHGHRPAQSVDTAINVEKQRPRSTMALRSGLGWAQPSRERERERDRGVEDQHAGAGGPGGAPPGRLSPGNVDAAGKQRRASPYSHHRPRSGTPASSSRRSYDWTGGNGHAGRKSSSSEWSRRTPGEVDAEAALAQGQQQQQQQQVAPTAPKPKPYHITLIRRDPTSGMQWNVATMTNVDPENPGNVRSDGSVHVEILNSGYVKFARDNNPLAEAEALGIAEELPPALREALQKMKAASGSAGSGSGSQAQQSMAAMFEPKNFMRTLALQNLHPNNPKVDAQQQQQQAQAACRYMFSSPWHGTCAFTPGASGHTLKLRHAITPVGAPSHQYHHQGHRRDASDASGGNRRRSKSRDPSPGRTLGWMSRDPNSVVAAEIRFNLPMLQPAHAVHTQVRHGKSHSVWSSRPFSFGGREKERLAQQQQQQQGNGDGVALGNAPTNDTRVRQSVDIGSMPRNTGTASPNRPGSGAGSIATARDVEPDPDRLDLSLGRERAGGGMRGKSAKLGKLVLEDEGLKMMDLTVAACMAVWWGAYEVVI